MSYSNLLSPIEGKQIYIWFAKDMYGNVVEETYTSEGKYLNSKFDDINRNTLKEFGLFGRGVEVNHDCKTGIMNLFGKKIEFYFEDENQTKIDITGIPAKLYNDVINYKAFYQDFSVSQDRTKTSSGPVNIGAYLTGYKLPIITPKGDLHFQVLFEIPIGYTMNFKFRFAPKFDLKGHMYIKIDKEIRNVFEVEVGKDKSADYMVDFIG